MHDVNGITLSVNISEKARKNAILFFLILPFSGLVFFIINWNLLQSGFYQNINVAFDFDQAWFFESVAYPPQEWTIKSPQEYVPLLIKHPFLYLYRIPSEFFQLFGLSPELSVILLSLMFHLGTLTISYFIFLNILNSTSKSILMTLLFACSTTFLVNGIVLDSYVLAGFWISCCFYLYINNVNDGKLAVSWLKILVYSMAIGTTTYLLLLVLLLEFCTIIYKRGTCSRSEICHYLLVGSTRFLMIFLMLFIICYYQSILSIISDPIGVIKRTLWAVVRPGEKENLLSISMTFIVHSFVAPIHSVIEIESNKFMSDFRGNEFSVLAYINIALLFILSVRACINGQKMFFVAFSWVLITMIFHLEYQDRGSLFLYTGHTILATCIMLSYGIKNLELNRRFFLLILFVFSLACHNILAILSAIQSVQTI